jgi:hypothetical protein
VRERESEEERGRGWFGVRERESEEERVRDRWIWGRKI